MIRDCELCDKINIQIFSFYRDGADVYSQKYMCEQCIKKSIFKVKDDKDEWMISLDYLKYLRDSQIIEIFNFSEMI